MFAVIPDRIQASSRHRREQYRASARRGSPSLRLSSTPQITQSGHPSSDWR